MRHKLLYDQRESSFLDSGIRVMCEAEAHVLSDAYAYHET